MGAGNAGGGGGGAEEPALGATGVKVAPFSEVVPCIWSINRIGDNAVSPRLNEANPNR